MKILPQMRYVVGFAFDHDFSHVLLIWKNRPLWQAGKLNGIGGKIEPGELPLNAMIREFAEETGIMETQWKIVGRRFRAAIEDNQPGSYEMYMYAAQIDLDLLQSAVNPEGDEEVTCQAIDMENIRQMGVPGLPWCIDGALCSLREGFHMTVEDPMIIDQ